MAIESTLSSHAPRVLSIVRIVAGLIFLAHGTQKLLGFPASDMRPPLFSIFGLAGAIEIVAGVLIVIGLFTGEQVGVDRLGIDRRHAVREARIGLERAVLQELDRDSCAESAIGTIWSSSPCSTSVGTRSP
jgi:hypothetical protein